MMKMPRYIMTLLIALTAMGSIMAQTVNRLVIPDVTVQIGQTQLPVAIENSDEIVAAQFDLMLPEGIAAEAVGTLTSRGNDHAVTVRSMGGNLWRVLLYSPQNRPLRGQSGVVMYIPITIPSTYTENQEYELAVANAVLSNAATENVLTETIVGKIKIDRLPDVTVSNITAEQMSLTPGERMVVSWQVENKGGLPTSDGWSEQIALVSADGSATKLLATTYYDGTLGAGAVVSRQAEVTIPLLMGIDGEARLQVRILGGEALGESVAGQGNNTVYSEDLLVIGKILSLTLQPTRVQENSNARVTAMLNRSGRWTDAQTFMLTATEDNRLTLPASITIPAGQSGAAVYLQVADNSEIDADSTVIITAMGNGYANATASLIIEDNEYPDLTLTASKSVLTEGDTFQLTVTTSRASQQPIVVALNSETAKRFTFPAQVTIPAGETSATVDVTAIDDEVPSLELSNTFTATAPKHNKGEVIVVLKDNDLPVLELTLTPTTVSESAGPVAIMAVLRRLSHTDQNITVKLSDDSGNGSINYGSFASLAMDKGVEEIKFSIGVNDNIVVDGDRDVTITAAVYIKSCSCSAANVEGVGATSQTISIIDNDGPSLTLTSSRSMLLEGADEATVLTVTRNTDTTMPLSVCVTSSHDESLEYEHNVVIPAGERSVRIVVKALANDTQNDDVTVAFTATAEGHGNGTCWAMVSDATFPDAIISSIELQTEDGELIGDEAIYVNTDLQVLFTVENIGVAQLPAGTVVNVYNGSNRIASMLTPSVLAPGENLSMTGMLTASAQIGTFSIYAKVNEDKMVEELLYANNTSPVVTFKTRSTYNTMVFVDKSLMHHGDSVTISGYLLRPDGSDWEDGGQSNVNLYLIIDGNRYVQTLTTDVQGRFSYVWKPSSAYMGHVSIGACYPGESTRDEMASVDIYGMRNAGSVYTTLYMVKDKPYEGTVSVKNPGRIPLTGLTVKVTENPDNATISFIAPETIGGGETATIRYTLIGNKLTEGDEWEMVKFDMVTTEGPKQSHTLYYYTRNPQAQLSCSLKQIKTTMTKGKSRDYSFNIANIGMGETGKISIDLPQWIQSVTPRELSSLALGDTVQVVLRFTPTDDMQLNIPVTGRIGINCDNGNGLSVPFSIEPVSESTGVLVVDVCDEYTYNTAEAPHLSGATVSLLHPVTGAVVVRDTTATDGCFHAVLPEGYYTLVVTHQKHDSYRTTILLDPGKTTYKVVNLSYNTIEISWEVVETEVEDTYEVVTSVNYETNVPAPVVTVNLPESIPAKELGEGESLVYYAVLTNKGMITAEDVQYTMPEGFNVLTFERLDNLDGPLNIEPGQSVVIPIKVTNSTSVQDARRRIKPVNDPCIAQSLLGWFWECGTDRKWHKYPTGLRVGDCNKDDARQAVNRSDDDAGTYAFNWGRSNNGPSETSRPNNPSTNPFNKETPSSNQNSGNSTGEPYECKPCQNSALLALAKLLPVVGDVIKAAETAKDIYNCYDSFKTEKGAYNKLSNCKYTSFATKYYDTVNTVCDDLEETYGHGKEIAGHIKNGEFFTDDCQEDWKNLFGSLINTSIDAIDLTVQTQNIYYKGKKYEETAKNIYGDVKSFGNDVIETNKVITDYENTNFYYTEDYSRNRRLDLEANGYYDIVAEQRENRQKESLYQYASSNIASSKEYVGLAEYAVKELKGKEIKGSDVNKLGKNVFKVLSDRAYNMHVFAENAKTMSVTDQSILKSEWLDTTKKVGKYAGDAAELLHYTFGECEYEGEEAPSDDSTEPGEGGDGKSWSRRKKVSTLTFVNAIPASYQRFVDDMLEAINIVQTQAEIEKEYFGSEEWLNLSDLQLVMVSWAIEQLDKHGLDVINDPMIGIYCPEGISEDMLKTFLRRLYDSREKKASSARRGVKVPEAETDGLIDFQRINQLRESIAESVRKILKGGESSIEEALLSKFNTAYNELSEGTSSVCATVSLQFNQTTTLTRQAFRGTLKVFNGNQAEAMKNITLQLEVRNAADGTLATNREMQISAESLAGFEGELSLTDGWTLGANANGTATIMFIPSKYAAPTEPVNYTFGGRLNYLDPFTGLMVTRELSPVTLTVKPSPELDLTYFMQRDLYGDDPLTEKVEAMMPAEFALLINNKGYGDATNVRMQTQQPVIIDNEKGLLVNFDLISSQVNGGEASLSFGKSIANDFGTIPAHSHMYAQWWLQSSLLGHFTDYDVKATHVTSYGNPDLSLLDQVTIHELIHGFNMPKGTLTGGPEMGHAFLVNDIADANDLPDRLYFTNGDTASVAQAVTAEIVRKSDTQYELTITPSAVGWNYGSVYDPTHGYAELKSIVRKSDGLEFACVERGLKCPFWQTDRTLRDGKDWLYEYCLHFVDDFATANSETYVLTFDALPETVLEVVSIETVPEEGKIAEEPIEQLTVTFNKAVDAATFTGDDITFAVQGAKKDATQIGISTEDNRRFVLDMTAMNDTLSNGYYTLSVQTANITDAEGYKGKDGKQVSWILYRGGLVCLLTSAYPHDAGNIRLLSTPADARCHAPSVRDDNSAQYGSTVTLNAEAAVGYEFSNWTLNGEVVGTEPTLVTTALGDMDIVANFSPKTYLVEIATEGSGGTVIGSGTGIYEHGTQLVLTALPDDDYMLKGWYINGKAVSETNETLGLQVDSTMTIKAVFEREYYRQRISLARGWNWVSSYIREEWPIEQMSTYANRIVGQFSELVSEPQFGLTGNLEHLTAGAAYKVEAMERFSTSFRGHLLTDPVKLEKGWNWVAYPWMETRTVSATITDAEEGDYLVSQHGFTEYADGYWEGSLRTLVPGEGYLYKSVSDKTLVYDFMDAPAGAANTLMSMNSSIDINAYPNTMNVTARLYEDGYELTGNDYILYAMNGDELRGVGEYVGSNHYITVYGDQPVNITFVVENSQTGAAFVANEQLTFCDDVVGSRQQPFAISIGSTTGIAEFENGKLMIDNCVYDLQGRKVHANSSLFNTQSRKGIYIVNGHKVVNGKYVNR